MPEPLFERLYRETTTMNWQPTEDIRRRGERRAARRRLTVAGSAFAAVVILVSVAVLAWRPTGAPIDVGVPTSSPATPAPATTTPPPPTGSLGTSAPPSSPPKPVTELSEAALLQPVDVGNPTSVGDRPLGDWSLGYYLSTCPVQVSGPDVVPVDSGGRTFQFADGRLLLQEVRVDRAGDAEHELAWFRGKIAACRTFNHYDLPLTVRIVAESFGGNESLVVEVGSKNGTTLYVLVRAGNVVTEIQAGKYSLTGARTVGERAAARLCSVTGTC